MQRSGHTGPQYRLALALTLCMFALWGFGHRLCNSLLPQFAEMAGLDDLGKTGLRSTFAFVYLLGAVPAALCARRFGSKTAILFGLATFCISSFLLYPAADTRHYGPFLAVVAFMAAGWVLLEVSANPLIMLLPAPENAIRRLNFAQSFYPLGAIAGLLAANWLLRHQEALPQAHAADSITHPYIVMGLTILALAFFIGETRFPGESDSTPRQWRRYGAEFAGLLREPRFLFALVAQGFGMLALANAWETTLPGIAAALPLTGADTTMVMIAVLLAFAAGRLIATALMIRFRPADVLLLFAAGGAALTGIAASVPGALPLVLILASCFFLGPAWATILGLAVEGRGQIMKPATALLCMSGPVSGITDRFAVTLIGHPSPQQQAVISAVAFVVVAAFAWTMRKAKLDVIPEDVHAAP